MNLKIENWKYFKIGELFEYSTSDDDYLSSYEKGNTEYISSTAENNGIAGMINAEHSQQKNTLTIARNGSVGSTFYHSSQYCASSDDVRILTPKFNMNKYTGLFITTLINKEKYKFSYGRKLTKNKVLNMEIRLPSDKNGNPDREFMESYIKSLRHKPITTKNKSGKNSLNIDKWKEFRVGNLFECSTTKLSIKDDLDIGEIPLISRRAMNNGCDGCFDIEQSKITKKGCITIGAEGIYAFYQPEDFGTGNKVYTLKNDKLNKYSALFICTVLNKEDYKYSYGRARILSKIVDEIIKLPVDSSGNPDREFMENYIRNLPYGDRI